MNTEVPLRDYLEARIKNVEDKIDALTQLNAQRFSLNELAIKKTEDVILLRLESMNQFKEQMSAEKAKYATKESMASVLEAYDSRLKRLELANSFSAGKMWTVMAGFAAIPTVISVIALVLGIIR